MKNKPNHLRNSLERIYENLQKAENQFNDSIANVHPQQTWSATNLIHYLALRRENLRPIQDELHDAGLSSLASSESHVMRQVRVVLQRMGKNFSDEKPHLTDASGSSALLARRAKLLFGQKSDPQIPHLMITFDANTANDYAAVKNLLLTGMNIARINSAHDDPECWRKMIANVRKATAETGFPCKIYFDLAGPKIRTTLLGKGQKKGRLKIKEQERIYLAETDAVFNKKEKVIGCTLKGVVKDLRTGERVLFDDGLFEAIVEIPGEQIATLSIKRISADKPRIKPEKGINFPDSALSVRCLTDYDKSLLPFAQQYADILGFSFVRSAADVAALQSLLRETGGKNLPLILKIETVEAVQNLPKLLLQGMAEPVFGVMIARGDLAVEIGFERLGEIQEEILWICEAAHVPVIWATQVLETLNKSGVATRSEVTDAVRSAHAECVMLNKGKYLLKTLVTLKNILHRTGGHHAKKRYVFRPLMIAERFLGKH